MKDEDWKRVVDINLTSSFLLSKHAIKKMLKTKFGRVVNIPQLWDTQEILDNQIILLRKQA